MPEKNLLYEVSFKAKRKERTVEGKMPVFATSEEEARENFAYYLGLVRVWDYDITRVQKIKKQGTER
jgi:hypothetical protein